MPQHHVRQIPCNMQFCGTWCWGKTEMTCVTYRLAECLWTGQQKTAWNDWPIESKNLLWGLQHVRTKQRFTHFLLLPLKKSQYLVLSGRRKSAKARKVSQTKARFHVDLLTQLLVAIDLRGELVTCFDLVNSMKVDWWLFSSFFHWFLPLWVKLLSTTTGSLGKKHLSHSWLKASLVSWQSPTQIARTVPRIHLAWPEA